MRDDEEPLTESAARRLLARAVELDAKFGSLVTRDELRSAALEAGISAVAFDAASRENPLPTGAPRGMSLLVRFQLNMLAAGGFYLLLRAGGLASGWLGGSPTLVTMCLLGATAAGIALAHRLSARFTRDILIAVGTGQLVVFGFTLAGVRVTEPHVLNWGVLFTGALATLGARMRMGGGRPPFSADALERGRTLLHRIRDRISFGSSRSSSAKSRLVSVRAG
jgi:hypothetical protein